MQNQQRLQRPVPQHWQSADSFGGAHSCVTLRVTQISRQSDGAAGTKCRNERKRVESISSRGSRAGNTPASLDHGPAQGTLVLLAHRLQHEAPHLIAEQCLQQEGVRACSPTCILLNGETPPLCAVRTCTSSRSYHRSTFTAPCQTSMVKIVCPNTSERSAG